MNRHRHLLASAAIVGVLAMPLGLHAASHPAEPANSPPAQNRTTEGEVRKIDKVTKKITIRHAELKHLDMPAMTMVFQVENPTLLEKIRQGDKVEFVAEKSGGRFILTHIETRQ